MSPVEKAKKVRHARRDRAAPAVPVEKKPPNGLQSIVDLLRARTKHDFRGYKKGTLLRRIQRRMELQQVESIDGYLQFLQSHAEEATWLSKDLRIGVSSFFRDAPAFDELAAKVLVRLIRDKDTDAPLRIWVPGCATGEEAYSMAIVVAEQVAKARSPCRVQLFATDADENAVQTARGGVYPETIALDVSPQRLKRFFAKEDHNYAVGKSVREMVVFARQDLITDPPFSKLDLVSCRNLLIYLEPDMQHKLLTLFHFALNPGGYLFLGGAESTGPLDDLFAPVSKRWRIYRGIGPAKRPLDFPFAQPAGVAGRATSRGTPEPSVATLAERQLLEHFDPAAVVVTRSGQVVRVFGPMDRYLNMPTGEAALDLVTLARDPLKSPLRATLHDAVRHNRPASIEVVPARKGEGRTALRITARPVTGSRTAGGWWLVIFEGMPTPPGASIRRAAGKQRGVVGRLEAELTVTKKDQQRHIRQLDRSNEELKAANEEVLSMNEELQSTNEELETSKEELQSMNEELRALNTQLQEKVQEVASVNDDLTHFLASSDIATVFVDTDFRVKRFTAAATELLNLIPSDVGRPINHLAHNLSDLDLSRDAQAVVRSLEPIEKEARARDGKQYIVRILPYPSGTRTVQGVAVTFLDVTVLKRTEAELRSLNQTLDDRVTERTKWLALMHNVTRAISDAPSWDEALRLVLCHIREVEGWQFGCIYLPDKHASDQLVAAIICTEGDRFQPFRLATEKMRFARAQSFPGRVWNEGKSMWVDGQKEILEVLPFRREAAEQVGLMAATALPITVGPETIGVIELFSDQPHRPSEGLASLMNDVGSQVSRVIERERLMGQVAELVWREQQELVHTLHDSLGQQLTGLGFLGSSLGLRLQDKDAAAAETAHQIAEAAQQALQRVRQLSKGLFPVEVDAEGLMLALRQLASTTESVYKIRCRLDDGAPVLIGDNRVATHLYRIAQEAVNNAVKHAEARTISIQVGVEAGSRRLRIADDGVGIRKKAPSGEGMGLRIMRYRAMSIGASLSIESGAEGGTVVTCNLRETPRPPQ